MEKGRKNMYRNLRVDSVDMLPKMRSIKESAEEIIAFWEDLLMQTSRGIPQEYDPDEYLKREVLGTDNLNDYYQKNPEDIFGKEVIRDA